MNLGDFFGESPKVRVLDLFIKNPDKEYNKSDISRITGVSRQTLQELCRGLVELNLIKLIGIKYKLNRYNNAVNAIINFVNDGVVVDENKRRI